jgi:3-methyladenine DNA glycosylase AlkC
LADVERIEERVSSVAHGFKEMKQEAVTIISESSRSESLRIAKSLYASDKYQARMVAVFVLGYAAARSAVALHFLRRTVSVDGSWQVQEILAQAFDQYCRDMGYSRALPTINDWLEDTNANVRRAVTEGLRIWTRRDYFEKHPDVAIKMLSKLKDDESEYVRRSVGNALRDISRREKHLVRRELTTWNRSDKLVAFTYKLASKFL